MNETYPIVDVAGWRSSSGEPLGSKSKAWLIAPDGERWLFKAARGRCGDDWAEKAAAELAGLLGTPRADVEMATLSDVPGSIGRDFLGARRYHHARLMHGNELLVEHDPTYPTTRSRRVAQHTVDRALDALIQRSARPPATILDGERALSAPEVFTGYLLLDAWIGNQDRHHENWAISILPGAEPELAPNYDLAASLGQILGDDERSGRLDTRDKGYAIQAWSARARSHLYVRESDAKPATTFDAFLCAAGRYPAAGRFWKHRLKVVPDADVRAVIERLPPSRVSQLTARFALRLLELNRERLLAAHPP